MAEEFARWRKVVEAAKSGMTKQRDGFSAAAHKANGAAW